MEAGSRETKRRSPKRKRGKKRIHRQKITALLEYITVKKKLLHSSGTQQSSGKLEEKPEYFKNDIIE